MTAWQHGPRILADGSVRFRLWAPTARSVRLALDDTPPLPMRPFGDGWYELDSADARAGSRYRFVIDDGVLVPDPASRFQPEDVDGPSEVISPAFDWRDGGWKGRPWAEAVIYELHLGAFTPEGTYAGAEAKLDYLAELGITAIELMPLADFPGGRNWGYDGVLPYAPDSRYGRPEDLKRLVQAAHARGMMVFLDVVYNHFGPAGNYLHSYAEHFFTEHHHTPWGAAINFDDTGSGTVRRYFIENALYWLTEFHIDGLRFDAVHAIQDDSPRHFLRELAETIRESIPADRHIHLILENEHNEPGWLEPPLYNAQWNDDFHHNCHVLMTGQSTGYYADFIGHTHERLARCLLQGFDYQGETTHKGKPRGKRCSHLPPTAFVNFLQNHDQIGNRALGERLSALASREQLRFYMPMLLLSPYIPMLFMGEEWACERPFLFFCDFEGDLADAVREGRRREFASFPAFSDPKRREAIPDPNAESTFTASRLDWNAQDTAWLDSVRHLLSLRHRHIVPLLQSRWLGNRQDWPEEGLLQTVWEFEQGNLRLLANFASEPRGYTTHQGGQVIHGEDNGVLHPLHTLWLTEARP